jgi:hypothetical protein
MGSSRRFALVSPGELTFQHGTVAQACTVCHPLLGDKPAAVLESAWEPHKGMRQTQLCLGCHQVGEHAARAHGLPPEQLADLKQKAHPATARAPWVLAAQRSLGGAAAAEGSVACGSCHREHQGPRFPISFMDNQRCQACHAQPFASLAHGHPEFVDYPYHQRMTLFFDHETHLGRHFPDVRMIRPDAQTPASCADCHQPDSTGRMMGVKNFSQTCASCHLTQILDVTLGGVRFLNLPGLDVPTLRRQEQLSAWVEPLTTLSGLPLPRPSPVLALAALFRNERLVMQPPFVVGEWPGMAAGEPSPFLQVLLSADREYSAAQASLQGVDLRDLRRANPTQLKAAAAFVWGVKGLLYDLIRDGDQALITRLERLVGPPRSAEPWTLLTGDLPPSAILEAQKIWLPTLLTEVAVHRAGKGMANANLASSKQGRPGPSQPASERWRRDDTDCSLQYLPREHADRFLNSWLDLAGRRYATAAAPSFAGLFDVLASPYQSGRCTKCHSVEAHADGSRTVHWNPAASKAHAHPFTKFAHQPHFSLNQCDACHTFQQEGRVRESFRSSGHTLRTELQALASEFRPMSRTLCSNCHTADKAGDNCLLCHNYHIGSFVPFKMPVLEFQDLRSGPGRGK